MNHTTEQETLRYPIGKLHVPKDPSKEQISEWIETVESFPSKVRELTENLSDEELDWKYRPGGWTIREVVHHVADSHINSLVRFKLTLTEDLPTIKPYLEDKWAELADSQAPVSLSLYLLEGLHARWSILLRSMSEDDFNKKLYHPEHKKELSLMFMLGLYSWHCRHHLAHIQQALDHEGQFN